MQGTKDSHILRLDLRMMVQITPFQGLTIYHVFLQRIASCVIGSSLSRCIFGNVRHVELGLSLTQSLERE